MNPITFHSRITCIALINIFFATAVQGQTTINFDYDNSGNRVKSYIIPLKSGAVVQNDSAGIEEIAPEEEKFEQQLGEARIRIFPNPTRGELKIELEGFGENQLVKYSLFDQSGKLLMNGEEVSRLLTIEMSTCSSGLYVLILEVEGKVSEWKVLKQ
jgi:hypothetical protein